jgi:hypothetical protein
VTLLRVTRAGSFPLSANGRAFLLCCLECPCIPDGRAGKGKACPAAWWGRDNRVKGESLGGNRAPARGRNRNSQPEPTPKAALAGFLGPAGMAGGSTGLETVRVEVSGRQSVDPLPCLLLKARPAPCRDHRISLELQDMLLLDAKHSEMALFSPARNR